MAFKMDTYIPIELQHHIVMVINKQCELYRKSEKETKKLYYEPYSKRREKYCTTAAVLSGFAPDRFRFEGVTVRDLQYGPKNNLLYQPELISNAAVIQVYSNGANPLKNKIVIERCEEYSANLEALQRFFLIRFTVNKEGFLTKVAALLLNENCEIEETKVLFSNRIGFVQSIAS